MTPEDLEKGLSVLASKQNRLKENDNYVKGKNPYIMGKPEGKKPDNRMPVTLAKMAVDSMAGYAGKAGNIKVDYDLVATDAADDNDPFIDYMRTMDDLNDTDIEISELYEEVLKNGVAYEIFWASDELGLPGGQLTTEYKIVPAGEMLVKYDRGLKPEILHAVHYTKDDELLYANVYYPGLIESWEKKIGGDGWKMTGVIETVFSSVPVSVYKGNRQSQALFEAEKAYIDGIDEIISKAMNEVDRFNAAIALFGHTLGKAFVEDFKQGKISVVDGIAEDPEINYDPKYMEKNLSGVKDFYENLMDRMETWFRKSIGVADFSDEAFAGQQSGVAIKFKLIPMEFRAAQIETYFNKGLIKRLDFYSDVYTAGTNRINTDDYTVKITSKRNIPADIEAKVRVATMLMGSISKEAFLNALPEEIIPDIKKELARLEEEKQSNSDAFVNSFPVQDNLPA